MRLNQLKASYTTSLLQVKKAVGLLMRLNQREHAHDFFLAPRTVAVMDEIDNCRNIGVVNIGFEVLVA